MAIKRSRLCIAVRFLSLQDCAVLLFFLSLQTKAFSLSVNSFLLTEVHLGHHSVFAASLLYMGAKKKYNKKTCFIFIFFVCAETKINTGFSVAVCSYLLSC